MLRRISFIVIMALMAVWISACSEGSSFDISELPEGDAARGETLFAEQINGAPSCASCHNLDDQVRIGPGMAGYVERAGSSVEGESAAVYTYHSIINPARYLTEGYQNLMYTQYGSRLDDQQVADLIAYLLTFN